MDQKVEWFFNTLCFTPFWGVLDLLCIFHFIISWYLSVRKTGWKIDFWYLTLLMWIVPSILFLYPFSGSIYNDLCTLGSFDRISPLIDRAFGISLLGYICLWMGRYLFDKTSMKRLFCTFFQGIGFLPQIVEKNIKSRRCCLFVFILAMVLGSSILFIQIQAGYLWNARGYFLQIAYLRPVFNLTISLFSIVFAILALRYIQSQEKRWLIFFWILLLFTPFLGIRSILLSSVVFFLSHRIFYRQGKGNLGKLLVFGSILWPLAIFLGDLRDGSVSFVGSLSTAAFKFFYGNNFSDIRDFAWILSNWDGEYLYGKSYLAAFLSFIPRYLIPFREEWAISMYTNSLMNDFFAA
ncbi:MAG: hypothetical protein HYZ48_04255 [Chlamydiales bacterium]|nr:hypothetical protein [Chlamydiales bacterium]